MASIYRFLCLELPVRMKTYMTLVSDSSNKHWSLSAVHLLTCQMLHIAVIFVVEALGLFDILLHINSKAKSSKVL